MKIRNRPLSIGAKPITYLNQKHLFAMLGIGRRLIFLSQFRALSLSIEFVDFKNMSRPILFACICKPCCKGCC